MTGPKGFDKLGANYILEAMRADVVSRDMVARSFSIATFANAANNRRWRGLRPMAYRSMDQLQRLVQLTHSPDALKIFNQ